MSLNNELCELAMANDMDYFGVSPVERFANVPVGHRSYDLLPDAKSVFVMGTCIPFSAIEVNKRVYEGLRYTIFSYVVYKYNKINDKLDMVALRTVLHIEKRHKYKAYPIPTGMLRNEYLTIGAMSNHYAAVCAGLGEFGWSGFVCSLGKYALVLL